jgi:Mn-dependent DtxR family transcriptional regulator
MSIHNKIHNNINNNINRNILMNVQIRKRILSYLGKEKVITSSELAKHLVVSWNTAEKYLLELIIERKVEKIKKKGVNLWLKK